MGHGGKVVTIEPNDDMINAATVFLKRANLFEHVQIERGKALDVMPLLRDTFDLLYIDAVKEEYAQYLDRGLPLLRQGGVVIVDNLLWGGRVAQPAGPNDDDSTRALREFNRYFMKHPQLRSEILSVGDGLGYALTEVSYEPYQLEATLRTGLARVDGLHNLVLRGRFE
jgi:predicted O-methyltransferase YrrM